MTRRSVGTSSSHIYSILGSAWGRIPNEKYLHSWNTKYENTGRIWFTFWSRVSYDYFHLILFNIRKNAVYWLMPRVLPEYVVHESRKARLSRLTSELVWSKKPGQPLNFRIYRDCRTYDGMAANSNSKECTHQLQILQAVDLQSGRRNLRSSNKRRADENVLANCLNQLLWHAFKHALWPQCWSKVVSTGRSLRPKLGNRQNKDNQLTLGWSSLTLSTLQRMPFPKFQQRSLPSCLSNILIPTPYM